MGFVNLKNPADNVTTM